MRANTIVAIREILKERKEEAQSIYISLREELKKKYDVELCAIEQKLTIEESMLLGNARNNRNNALELWEDFERHMW